MPYKFTPREGRDERMLAGLVPCVLDREGVMESKKSLCLVLVEKGGRRSSLGALTPETTETQK